MIDFKFPSLTEVYNRETLVGNNIFIFEKVDGGNCSIRKDGQAIVPWSRGGPIRGSDKYFFNAFRRFVFGDISPEIYGLPEELVVFGEFTHSGYGHILYDPPNMNSFFCIGIYDGDSQTFLEPADVDLVLEQLGIREKVRSVPLLGYGSMNRERGEELLNQSFLYQGPPEGITIHQYSSEFTNGLRIQKWYHPDFQEFDPSKDSVDRFLTRHRFVKAGQKIIGSTLEPVTMPKILETIVDDIFIEASKRGEYGVTKNKIRKATDSYRTFVEKEILPLFQE